MPFFLAPVSPAGEYLFFARTKENARMSPPMSCPQIKTWAFPRHSARHSRKRGNDGRRMKIPSIDWLLAYASMTIEILDSRFHVNDEPNDK